MYLHLGADIVVSSRDIVAILDLEKTTVSKITRDFLGDIQKKAMVINVSNEMPKSYVITKDGEKEKVFISPISSATLLKRAELADKQGRDGMIWDDIR